MDRDKALEKIKKCLALAASDNEHEAAAAMRQAQTLIREYGFCDAELNGVTELFAKSGARQKPSAWEAELAEMSSAAFGCEMIFSGGDGRWLFIGVDIAPELSRYAFEVLLRQVKHARRSYIANALRRCGNTSKTRRADLFCLGWVRSARSAIDSIAPTTEQIDAIAQFISTKYPSLSKQKPIDRNKGKRASEDYFNGSLAGHDAQLNHGVNGGSEGPLRIGASS